MITSRMERAEDADERANQEAPPRRRRFRRRHFQRLRGHIMLILLRYQNYEGDSAPDFSRRLV